MKYGYDVFEKKHPQYHRVADNGFPSRLAAETALTNAVLALAWEGKSDCVLVGRVVREDGVVVSTCDRGNWTDNTFEPFDASPEEAARELDRLTSNLSLSRWAFDRVVALLRAGSGKGDAK